MNARVAQVQLDLDGHLFAEVISCRIVEGLSRPTTATIEVASVDEAVAERSILRPARLTVTAGVESRSWSLLLGAVRFLGAERGAARHAFELMDPLHRLRFIQGTRKFRDVPAERIVSTLLDESRIPHAWRTQRRTDSRPWCVQYRETNHDFIVRLLSEEGIHYTFDPDGAVVFGDTSLAAAPVDGRSHFELIEAGDALAHGEAGVHALSRGRRVAPGVVTVNDHDWKRPDLSLLATSAASRDAELEVYQIAAGYRDPEAGARIARTRLEAHRATAEYTDGKSGVLAFAPGRKFSFGDEAGAMFAGEHLICQVEHDVRDPALGGGGGGAITPVYENAFSAIPANVPFRPPLVRRPHIAGHHTAMVRGPGGSEIHTDAHGRFKAQFHWDREAAGTDQDSRWVRVLQESANSMFLGRVGWEMTVGYEGGDPDRPVGVARNINGVMAPSYPQPASKNMMAVQTPSSPASGGYSELKLDDTAGGQSFDLRAEKDYSGIVEHDQTERIGQNETHLVGANLGRTVRGTQTITIGADSVTTVNGQHRLFVKKDRKSAVGGSESIDVIGPMSVTVKGNEKEKVGSVRLTVAGSLASPAEVAKALIPSPKTALLGAVQKAGGDLFAAARGATIGEAEALVGQIKGAASTVQALPGAVSGLAGTFGQLGSAQGVAGIAGAGQGALSGAQSFGRGVQSLPGTVSGALGAAQALPGAVAGIPGAVKDTLSAMPDALKGAGAQALQELKNMVPSPAAVLDAFLKGSINRNVTNGMSRMVGGAFLSAAVGDFATKASKAYIETIGGAKLTVVGGSLERKAGKVIATTVGGKLLRVSKGNMSFDSAKSKVTVGQSVELVSKTSVTLHADVVRVKAGAGLAMGNDVIIELTPGKVALTGEVKVESPDVTFFGSALNVTNPPTPAELAAQAAAEAAAAAAPAAAPAPAPPGRPGRPGGRGGAGKGGSKGDGGGGQGQSPGTGGESGAGAGAGAGAGGDAAAQAASDGYPECQEGGNCSGADCARAKETKTKVLQMIDAAAGRGWRVGADLLSTWLSGRQSGNKIVSWTWLLDYWDVRRAVEVNRVRFARDVRKAAATLSDGTRLGVRYRYDAGINTFNASTDLADLSVLREMATPFQELDVATGASHVHSTGTFTLTRTGDHVDVDGSIAHEWKDDFDFNKPGQANASQTIWMGRLPERIYDQDMRLVEQCCGARPFAMRSYWRQSASGRIDHSLVGELMSGLDEARYLRLGESSEGGAS